MPEDSVSERSKLLTRLYARYREEFDVATVEGHLVPYHWWNLADPLPTTWFPYALRLHEFATEIANTINSLTQHVRRFEAWAIVFKSLSEDEILEVTHEFLEPLGTVAMGLPYVIKSRFSFAAIHLCYEINFTRDARSWSEKAPDDTKLYFDDIGRFCLGWKSFDAFKSCLDRIASKDSDHKISEFRNAYNHRFPARIGVGYTQSVRRIPAEKGMRSYSIGQQPPLSLDDVIGPLKSEMKQCYSAFEAFQDLVSEHIIAIDDFKT